MGVRLSVDQQQVGFYVALAVVCQFAAQPMIAVLFGAGPWLRA
jgi:hypothetical protein